jgi:hypothetical protein
MVVSLPKQYITRRQHRWCHDLEVQTMNMSKYHIRLFSPLLVLADS